MLGMTNRFSPSSPNMKPAVVLRQRIAATDPVLGLLATFHFWPGLVEMAIDADFDYLIIDLEHLTHNAEAVAEACAFGRRVGFPILIRPPSAEFTPVRLAMDLGPCGLLVPYIETAEALNEVRDAVYMKPRGRRRPGGPGNAWVKDYNYSTWKSDVEDHLIILPQIETKLGLKNVDAIVGHELTTAIAIGPYDLSADLGVCWEPNHPLLAAAYTRVRESALAANKNTWVVGDGPTLLAQGFNFICLTESTMYLKAMLKNLVSTARRHSVSPKKSTGKKPVPI